MTAITCPLPAETWWRKLTRPRGDVVWDGMVRGTGVVGLATIGAMALVPKIVPLVGFLLVAVVKMGWSRTMLSPATEPRSTPARMKRMAPKSTSDARNGPPISARPSWQ